MYSYKSFLLRFTTIGNSSKGSNSFFFAFVVFFFGFSSAIPIILHHMFLVLAARGIGLGLGLAFKVFHYLVNLLFQFINLTFLTHRHNLITYTKKKKESGIYNNAAACAAVMSATTIASVHWRLASHLIR